MPLHRWQDQENLIGGRDGLSGGTWLGVSTSGRFAAVTNHRSGAPAPGPLSRGEIPVNFLSSDTTPDEYRRSLESTRSQFDGYNAIFGDHENLYYFSNRSSWASDIEKIYFEPRPLSADCYGLSNGLLNTPWPKLISGKDAFSAWVKNFSSTPDIAAAGELFLLLRDDNKAPDEQLPTTGVSIDRERMLSSRFIQSEDYGTRSSTVAFFDRQGNCSLFERQWLTGETRQIKIVNQSVKSF